MLVAERLDVSHNFVTIDSPIKFFLEINGDVKTRVLKSSQAIQIDCRKLLTKKDMPNFPAWTLSLIYDDSLLAPGEKVNWYPHDVDFAGSQDSVNGQLVDVDLSVLYTQLTFQNQAVVDGIDNLGSTVSGLYDYQDNIKNAVDAVKKSVDAKHSFIYCHLSDYFMPAFSNVFGFTLPDVVNDWVRVELKSPMFLKVKKGSVSDVETYYVLSGAKILFHREVLDLPDVFGDSVGIIGEYYYRLGESTDMQKRVGVETIYNDNRNGMAKYWLYL